MHYAKNRFYQGDTQFKGADGNIYQAKVYTYESGRAIYNVLVINGLKFVRTNCGPLSNFINSWTPHHYAIESHFGLNA